MNKKEREFSVAIAALIISIGAAGFTGLQWYEARRTRIDVHDDAEKARELAERQFEVGRQDAQSSAHAQEVRVKESAASAERSAKAAEKNTVVAQESVRLSRQLFEISERAQVHVKKLDITVTPKAHATASVEIENVGKTVARNAICVANIAESLAPLNDNPADAPRPKGESAVDLVAGDVRTVLVRTPEPMLEEEVKAIGAGTTYLYVWGHIEYSDVFDHPHRTTFCAQYNPQQPQFAQACQHFNNKVD
jgi:hypothetical protein